MSHAGAVLHKEPEQLQKNILSTYLALRLGIAVVGIALPVVVSIVGYLYAQLCLQRSISAYYHAVGPTGHSMRDWFVGSLFVVGTFLYLYKGFSRLENWLLNIGGLSAVLVALVPMQWKACDPVVCGVAATSCKGPFLSAHGIFSYAVFVCMAAVCFFCAGDTLQLLKDAGTKNADQLIRRYKVTYKIIAGLMLASIAAAYLLNTWVGSPSTVFWVETAGVWSFGVYWLVKSHELKKTAAEAKAACGVLTRHEGKLRDSAVLNRELMRP
jgi:uncharacterized membrane protein YbaN (DUF454 family)